MYIVHSNRTQVFGYGLGTKIDSGFLFNLLTHFVKNKGVFSKPSGKYILVPDFCFFELETSNFGYLLIFKFC